VDRGPDARREPNGHTRLRLGPLITSGSSSLRHRILFGTCSWLSPQPANLLATEVIDLVGHDVADDWLHGNTLRLLEGH
jgi:uncharacterized protein